MDTWLTHKTLTGLPVEPESITPKKRGRKALNKPLITGIYLIENTANDRCYIGKSNRIDLRFRQHKHVLNKNKSIITPMQSDWNIHKNLFVFKILEECDIQSLKKLEKKWIEEYLANSREMYNTIYVVKDKTIVNIKKDYEKCIKKVIEVLDKELITSHELMEQLNTLYLK